MRVQRFPAFIARGETWGRASREEKDKTFKFFCAVVDVRGGSKVKKYVKITFVLTERIFKHCLSCASGVVADFFVH